MANGVLLNPGQGETITAREQRDVVIKASHPLMDVTWSRYAPGQRGPEPHIHRRHADSFYVLDGEVTFTLGSDEREVRAGDGTFSLTEITLAPGFPGPVPHRHQEHVDTFYVLDGTLTLRLGEETVEARPGSYAVALPGVTHTFSNTGDETVRALNAM